MKKNREFQTNCPRCGRKMVCSAWTSGVDWKCSCGWLERYHGDSTLDDYDPVEFCFVELDE